MLAYLNGQYLPYNQITISPDDRGFLFADGLYEVIRSYEGKLFRLQDHLDRLAFGAQQIRLNQTRFDFLTEVCERLIQDNGLTKGDTLVYVQVTRGVAQRQHRFPPSETPLTVYASARSFQSNQKAQENGINVILVPDQRWGRTDIKSVGLLPNVLAHQQAMESGAVEALFVREGAVLEGTHSNIFAVIAGEVITPPKSNHILSGITRQGVLELCQNLAVPFHERQLGEEAAFNAEELFITGTTVEITPVVQLNGQEVGTGKAGGVTRKLQGQFQRQVNFFKKVNLFSSSSI